MAAHNTSFTDKLSELAEKIKSMGFFSRTPDKKTIVILFFTVLALIGGISGILVIDEIRDAEETTASEVSAEESTASVSAEVKEIQSKFLLVLGDEEEINLISLVGLDSVEQKVRVAFISPEAVCYAGNKTATMTEHFRDGGILQLREAVSSFADVTIGKYVLGDESDFTNLIMDMGEFPVMVDERVEASHDGVSFIIDSGEQVLIPDMMLKYFLYLCENQPVSYVKLANIMMLLGEKLFSTGDDESLENNINIFISGFETDISALDFSEYKLAVKKLATKEVISGMIIEGKAYHLGETTLN